MNNMSLSEIEKIIVNQGNIGYIVIDKNGKVVYVTKEYTQKLNIPEKDIIGKHITKVVHETKLDRVLKTKEAEFGICFKEGDNYMVGHRIPLFKNGELIGALGSLLFKSPEEAKYLSEQIIHLQDKLAEYKNKLMATWTSKFDIEDIVAVSPKMVKIKSMIRKIGKSDLSVLVTGETGVGKEVIASAIHNVSKRCNKPFVQLNCAAIPNELLESELFGYESGAFTGANKKGKTGKFEIADGGTIFLDEIGDMPYSMQAKLLRVLQENEIEKLGSNKKKKINVRVIAATNKDIELSVKEGNFRSDLYYRLNVIRIEVPPLRERKDDISAFIYKKLNELVLKEGQKAKKVDRKVMEKLKLHNWPGNVRELINVVEQMYYLSETDTIRLKDLPINITNRNRFNLNNRTLDMIIEEVEKEAILNALEQTNNNKSAASKLLGIHRMTLYKKLWKYNIDV